MRKFFYHLILILLSLCFTTGCVSSGGTRIDNIPMYGQPEIERPAILKKADQAFIKKASNGFGSRENASQAWWHQGEKFMSEGNFDYAMRRYNQSWLLNPDNYQPYWGFARILVEQYKFDEALKHLNKAKELCNDPYQKVALLSDIGGVYFYKAQSLQESSPKEKRKYFDLANKHFVESTQLDSTYYNSWRLWAFSLHEEGRYSEAMEKVNKAKSLGAPPFPEEFIKDLMNKSSK